ncbi:MAG: hypothetical protein IKH03_09295 [Oscillospiraceae bacterium]|nr:hypothetical protein [Oscillospiraceae bacterium]
MKSRLVSFLAGVVAALLLVALPLTALASDGSLTLTIHPIRVLVNGEVFQPKDVNGKDVLVFTYDGTTYAPLRALAEAYGLEVGYDAQNKIATVNGSSQAPVSTPVPVISADFSSVWTVKEKQVTHYGDERIFTASYNGGLDSQAFQSWWKSLDTTTVQRGAEQLAAEAQRLHPGSKVTMYFDYQGMMLGTAWAFGANEESNFRVAESWIK